MFEYNMPKQKRQQSRAAFNYVKVGTYLRTNPEATNREIADGLHMAVSTVARIAPACRAKLGIATRRGRRPVPSLVDLQRHLRSALAIVEASLNG